MNLSKLKADVAYAVHHPATARKAIVATLIHAAAVLAVLTTVVHTTALVDAAGTATAFITGAITFLTSNEVVKDADAAEALGREAP
jgi:hypothetical protein